MATAETMMVARLIDLMFTNISIQVCRNEVCRYVLIRAIH